MKAKLSLCIVCWALATAFLVEGAFAEETLVLFQSALEPNEGIRGLKWGTKLSILSDMQYIEDVEKFQAKAFRRKSDSLAIKDSLQLKDIEYYFWRGLLFQVNFLVEGKDRWGQLQSNVAERYPHFFERSEVEVVPGLVAKKDLPPDRKHFSFGGFEVWEMEADDVNLMAQYNAESQRGAVAIESLIMLAYIEETSSYPWNVVVSLQRMLVELGYDPGSSDGIWGGKTKTALEEFQHDKGLSVTGILDEDSKKLLGL